MDYPSIYELSAGRKLDAIVAERIFGLKPFGDEVFLVYETRKNFYCEVPHYSKDLSAAWEVVEEMHRLGRGIDLRRMGDYTCRKDNYYTAVFSGVPIADPFSSYTAPLAICKAALQVIDVLEREGK